MLLRDIAIPLAHELPNRQPVAIEDRNQLTGGTTSRRFPGEANGVIEVVRHFQDIFVFRTLVDDIKSSHG